MSDTILLDPNTWDLLLDGDNNVALAQAPYALAQDAASAIRTFSGEVFFDTTQGIPYFSQILGKIPPLALVKHYMNNAAKTVSGVASSTTYLTSFNGRAFTGQVQITSTSGATIAIGF